MDAIIQILTSANGPVIALLVVLVVIIGLKHTSLKIKTDKITIGRDSSEKERAIVRQQMEYVKDRIKAYEYKMPKFDGYNQWRGRTVTDELIIEINDWITQNNIRASPSYIELKQGRAWDTIQRYTSNPMFESDDFKEHFYKLIKELIETLVKIRKEYS